jgi:hypothetical protein
MSERPFTRGQTLWLRDSPGRGSTWSPPREAQVRAFREEYVYLTNKEGKFDPEWMQIEGDGGWRGTRVFASLQAAEEYPQVLAVWRQLQEHMRRIHQIPEIALADLLQVARLLGMEGAE